MKATPGKISKQDPKVGLQQKGRGRPQKLSQDAEEEHQRARVRRAQVAYRKRKEAHLSAVELKCRDLESVVEHMTNEFVGFSDRLIASGNPDASTIRDVRGTLERFLELSKIAAREIGDEEMPSAGSSELASVPVDEGISVMPGVLHSSVILRTLASADVPQPIFRDIQHGVPGFHETASASPFDPYNSTIWTPPNVKDMDNSIIPHILSGRDSFSSRLYFEAINLAVRSLQGEAPWEFAASMFRYKLLYAPREKLFGVLAGVLEMLLLGSNEIQDGRIPQREVENDGAVKASIVSHIVTQGGDESEYLPAFAVEKYITEKWRLGLDSNSVRVRQTSSRASGTSGSTSDSQTLSGSHAHFAPTMIPGFFQNNEIILNSEGLIDELKLVCVTIGAGPRWHIDSIDQVVESFLGRNAPRISEVPDEE